MTLCNAAVVQASKTERPVTSVAPGVHVPPAVTSGSLVECTGRTITVAFSEANGEVLIGGDVAGPQRARISDGVFRGYSAGGGNDGTEISYPNKKAAVFIESADYALWGAGSNGSGGIWRRDVGDPLWDLTTEAFWLTTNDGGSANPRRAGHTLGLIDGTTCYMACERAASPSNGIARSTDSGANWTAWSFGTSRNYTSLGLSPNWAYILAASDGRVGSSQDGVWIIPTATGTPVQADTIGAGAPDLVDVRCVFGVDENGDDCWFVVCGNAAGSDPDRGIWRLRITVDPNDGGFNPATHMTWTKIYTPGTTDRVQSVVAWKPNGGTTGPIYLLAALFSGSTLSSGSYVLSEGAGGGSNTYRVRAVRSLDADATTPIFDVITGSSNVEMSTWRTGHFHVLDYVGEQSLERSRMGGNSYQNQDLAISADGLTVVACGKATPWILTGSNGPWATEPLWQPFSRGLGLLEGGYASVYVPDIGDGRIGFAISDDDRGLYTFRNLDQRVRGPEWVIAENIDGATTTDNAMFGVSVDVGTPLTLLVPRRLNGRAYRITDPFEYDDAVIAAMAPDSSADPPAIAAFAWVDSLGNDRRFIANAERAWRDTTEVLSSFSADVKRTEFQVAGIYCWWLVPDTGIYRSQDNGATWTLWWNYGIANDTTNRYAGHMVLDGPTTLLVTWDTAGIWECSNAHVSAAGTGLAGSRPGETVLLDSGDLDTTDFVSAIDWDPVRDEIWGCGYDPTGATPNVLWHRRSGGTWVEIADEAYAESAIIPQALTVYDGMMLIGTASNGTLRRMAA